jgi:hypothetical protein
MDMAISNMPKKVGNLRRISRWYVIASYTFIQGGYKEKTYKTNGILKRGDDLILGNGEIQITLGASHFVNDSHRFWSCEI